MVRAIEAKGDSGGGRRERRDGGGKWCDEDGGSEGGRADGLPETARGRIPN